jgi:DNA adenine methylase
MSIPYVGGKTKYAAEILSVILPGNEHRVYWEPFVGSAALLVHVPTIMSRFANDKNPYLIAMHEAVRGGWIPPATVTEDEYKHIKQHPSQYPKELVGFVSIGCSFGAKMWGGYARDKKGTNYAAQSCRAVLNTIGSLQRVSFISTDYQELLIPDGALVYCDPPYAGTTDYGDYTTQAGDFWRWCDKLIARDCQVFVSGYRKNKPFAWEVAWSTEVKTEIDNSNGQRADWKKSRTECLFRPKQMHVDHLKAGTICKCHYEAADWEREAVLVKV